MQLLESLLEMHPDKIPGVVEQYIKEGELNSVRQAIPSLIHHHPQLREPLLAIAERLKQPPPLSATDATDNAGNTPIAAVSNDGTKRDVDAIETIAGDHAQVFACGNCGGTVSKQHPDSNHVICHYCGCDALHPPADGLARWRQLLDARSQFTIGSLFHYKKRDWQVIGVQCYSGKIREWDSEDKTWETNSQNISLWWLLNERRELAWMSDYGKSRYWSEKFIPFKPQMPAHDDKKVEHGTWELVFAAGEFSYMPYDGEKRESREYLRTPVGLDAPSMNSSKHSYSVETGMDANGEPEEIEFIRSSKLSDSQVLAGIGMAKLLDTVKRWSTTSYVFAGTIAALLITYGITTLLSDSTVVLEGSTVASTREPTELGTLKVETAGESFAFELASARFSANRYAEVILDIEDSDGVWAGGAEAEFWHETGRDSDGSWTETDYGVTKEFRFDNPGSYTLTLTPGATNLDAPPQFRATVRSHPNSFFPFILAGLAALAFAVISHMKAEHGAASGASIRARLRSNTSALPDRKKIREQKQPA